jgi:hypothetical protein
MTEGHNPSDRSKLGKAKRHILTDKKGISLSVVISSSASMHDIKLVTNVVDNVVIKRTRVYKTKTGRRRELQHLCLDKAYNSEPEEQELIKRGYMYTYYSKAKKRCKRITRGQDCNTTLLKSEKAFCKKMVDCRPDKFMAQQV